MSEPEPQAVCNNFYSPKGSIGNNVPLCIDDYMNDIIPSISSTLGGVINYLPGDGSENESENGYPSGSQIVYLDINTIHEIKISNSENKIEELTLDFSNDTFRIDKTGGIENYYIYLTDKKITSNDFYKNPADVYILDTTELTNFNDNITKFIMNDVSNDGTKTKTQVCV